MGKVLHMYTNDFRRMGFSKSETDELYCVFEVDNVAHYHMHFSGQWVAYQIDKGNGDEIDKDSGIEYARILHNVDVIQLSEVKCRNVRR